MDVAFIGLGNMGSGMARNLIKAGHTLTVYNRTRSRAEPLRSLGARIAASPGAAASDAEVLITMLADDHAVEEVMFAPGNVLESLRPEAVHVSMSTISVALSRRLTEAHREKRQHFVAAGPAEQIEHCRPLFDAMGQKMFVMQEEPPTANVVKLAGNFLITAVIESLAEATALVRKFGLDSNTFLEFLTGSLFAAPVYRTYGNLIAANQFEPAGFKLPLGFKDNRLLLAAAEEAAVPMPLASLVHDRFVAALAQGLTEADWSVIARISYQGAGLLDESESSAGTPERSRLEEAISRT
jgi:3-hydroxyisobutyrate dehydrogenase-like beta-hydroxyacid dehydrogenase